MSVWYLPATMGRLGEEGVTQPLARRSVTDPDAIYLFYCAVSLFAP